MLAKQILRVATPAIRTTIPARAQSVVSGPPQNHISSAEKVIFGLGMTCGWVFVPIWVLAHIKEYRGGSDK